MPYPHFTPPLIISRVFCVRVCVVWHPVTLSLQLVKHHSFRPVFPPFFVVCIEKVFSLMVFIEMKCSFFCVHRSWNVVGHSSIRGTTGDGASRAHLSAGHGSANPSSGSHIPLLEDVQVVALAIPPSFPPFTPSR